jgi:hypothetical protein
MHELNHINGKGDKDRSPGWREHYDEIAWPHDNTGFVRITPHRIRKIYSVTQGTVVTLPE